MFLLFAHAGLARLPRGVRPGAARAWSAGGGTVTAIALVPVPRAARARAPRSRSTCGCPTRWRVPTPVSALIHAATMVTAGVYLVARSTSCSPISPVACAVVAGVGALTALFAATIGLKQWDIKKVLAYSAPSRSSATCSSASGAGAYAAGVFHLVTHAFFKALLFLGAGSVIHAMHARLPRTRTATTTRRTCATWAACGLPAVDVAGSCGSPRSPSPASRRSRASSRRTRSSAPRSPRGDVPTRFWLPCVWVFGTRGGAPHRVLHDAADALHVPRPEPHGRTAPRRTCTRRPWVMTGPLVVLGVLTAAGRRAQPAARSMPLPALRSSPLTERSAALLPRAGALDRHASSALMTLAASDRRPAAIWLGVPGSSSRGAARRPSAHPRPRPASPGCSRDKYYVDEIYGAVIVRPLVRFSRVVLWKGLDAGVIDDGWASTAPPRWRAAWDGSAAACSRASSAPTWSSSSSGRRSCSAALLR